MFNVSDEECGRRRGVKEQLVATKSTDALWKVQGKTNLFSSVDELWMTTKASCGWKERGILARHDGHVLRLQAGLRA